MLLLKQKTIKKEGMNENITKLDAGNKNSKEYEMEAIQNNAFYVDKSESDHLPSLYYLVA